MTQATIVDSGPVEPKRPDKDASQDALQRYEREHADYEAWHALNKEPVHLDMHNVDANEAIARNPQRYTKVAVAAPVQNLSIEDRVARIEAYISDFEDDLSPADREKRAKMRSERKERKAKELDELADKQKKLAVEKRDKAEHPKAKKEEPHETYTKPDATRHPAERKSDK
jgi:hypothetical protein